MKLNNDWKSTLRIAKIELNSMFYSPVAWLVIFIFVCQIGFTFASKFTGQLHTQDVYGDNSLWSLTVNMFTGMQGILPPILNYVYLYIPLITMGLMSREYQSGSIKLLYSSPIKNSSIIFGKFLSMMIYGLVLLGILAFITIFCTIFVKDFDVTLLLSAMLGFYLLILSYAAIGLFMSSLTQYQVVAAIGTLALLSVLNLIGKVGQDIDFVRDITYWLSISNRSYDFIEGLIPSEDVIYFLIVIFFFLSLSIFKLNTEKRIMSLKKKVFGYSTIVLITLVLGYATSRPHMKFYADLSQIKANTLSKESQKIINDVKEKYGDIKIITYSNILSDNYYVGLPRMRNNDLERFEMYARFMPGIKMEYVLYYDKSNKPNFTAQRYPSDDIKETAEKVSQSDNFNFNLVLSPEVFKAKYMDLSTEGNRLVRILETKDGKRQILRMFNDNSSFPKEAEISAALSRLIYTAPMVAFSVGNGSREIDNYGGRGYYLFAKDKWFRNSLLNNGFDSKNVNLESDSLNDIDVLVISDLRTLPSDAAMENVQSYIAKGGNLFILGDYHRSENMNLLTSQLGVTFSDGVLVEENEAYSPSIIAAEFTQEAADKYFTYTKLRRYEYKVSVPTGTALDYSGAKEKGFQVIPVLETSPKSWLEYNTTDFIDGTFVCEAERGESKAVRSVMINLLRNINGKEQRIVVSGDADMISNEELTSNRSGIQAQNYAIINGSFRWLSYDKYPIDTSPADAPDNEIYLPKGSKKYVNVLFQFVIPLAMLVLGILIIVRRQKK